MKILLINSEYPPIGGGAGNASANIARVLARLGNEVLVMTPRFKGHAHHETLDGVQIVRIASSRRYLERSTMLEQLAFIFSASFQAPRLIRHFRPDATLAFFGIPSGAVALLLKIFHKIPYVVSLRGGDVPGFRPYDFRIYHKLSDPFLRVIWHRASAVVANSAGLRDLANAFDPTIDIPIIPNGVEAQMYSIEDRAWSPPRIFSAGRAVYQKGFDLALRALACVKHLAWEWSIAGDGPYLDVLRNLAHELDIEDRVIFLGWQSREEVIRQYRRANLFLFPSRHEGMPNAVLEAMASGLPVIASRIAGNEELVIEGRTGMLVPSEDVNALAKALESLIDDPALRRQMGHASQRRVQEQYNWENVARQYEELLKKAT